MGTRDSSSPSDDPYAALDVDAFGKSEAKKRNGCYRMTLPIDAIRSERVPLEEADVESGESVRFRVGVSKDVPGRIVLDLDRDQLPTPPSRR